MSVGDETREQQAKNRLFLILNTVKQPYHVWYQTIAKSKSSAIILLFFTFINARRCRNPRKNVWYTRLSIFHIAIGKISDLKRHLPGFRLVNA